MCMCKGYVPICQQLLQRQFMARRSNSGVTPFIVSSPLSICIGERQKNYTECSRMFTDGRVHMGATMESSRGI